MEKLLIPLGQIYFISNLMTIGFYLFNYNLGLTNNFNPNFYIVIGFLISFFLIFTRYMGSKRYILSLISPKKNNKFYREKKIINLSKVNSKFSFLENEILRGNFFAEPGMILNFFLIFYLKEINILEMYLILFIYNFVIFLKNNSFRNLFFKY